MQLQHLTCKVGWIGHLLNQLKRDGFNKYVSFFCTERKKIKGFIDINTGKFIFVHFIFAFLPI
jgi:hypothetical protein